MNSPYLCTYSGSYCVLYSLVSGTAGHGWTPSQSPLEHFMIIPFHPIPYPPLLFHLSSPLIPHPFTSPYIPSHCLVPSLSILPHPPLCPQVLADQGVCLIDEFDKMNEQVTYCTVPCCIAHYIILCSTALHCAPLHSTVLRCTVPHCAALNLGYTFTSLNTVTLTSPAHTHTHTHTHTHAYLHTSFARTITGSYINPRSHGTADYICV
jgi:hypothetical protein